jgi:hypothetical protein
VQAAAKFLGEHAECFPAGAVPGNPSQLAVLAIKVYRVFLKHNAGLGKTGPVPTGIETARAIIEANEKFEARRIKPTTSTSQP